MPRIAAVIAFQISQFHLTPVAVRLQASRDEPPAHTECITSHRCAWGARASRWFGEASMLLVLAPTGFLLKLSYVYAQLSRIDYLTKPLHKASIGRPVFTAIQYMSLVFSARTCLMH